MAQVKGEERNFNSAEEMLDALISGEDLYNVATGTYVFGYNDCGSIAVYDLSYEEAAELQEQTEEYEEGEMYWGAFLGPGGSIYDDPSYEYYTEDQPSNMDFCEEYYNWNGWIRV